MDFFRIHADPHKESGLRGIVSQVVLYVVHVEKTVACLQENVARDIDANCAAGEPCDLRACSKSADTRPGRGPSVSAGFQQVRAW